ncbi:MAG TPA: hypothetical protein VF116_15425 [Ktedonobacterales bacterium]
MDAHSAPVEQAARTAHAVRPYRVNLLMTALEDDFTTPLAQSVQSWHRTTPGGGTLDVDVAASVLRCAIPPTPAGRYANAQIDDYGGARLAHYPWRPPLRLEVRARTSLPIHPPDGPLTETAERAAMEVSGAGMQAFLRGTFGFGFWNAPLTVARGALRLPDAVWFFGASPPSEMRLVPGLPGRGWKAQVVHANRAGALVSGGAALGAVAWARLTGREQMAARLVRRMTGASEAALDVDTTTWHDYALEWHPDAARFFVDGVETLRAPDPPRGPLGFVAWIDNQYAIATPRGQLRFGTLATGSEWLELDAVRITAL